MSDLIQEGGHRVCKVLTRALVVLTQLIEGALFACLSLVHTGVDEAKLRIVPIAVNTTMFDPAVIKPLTLPVGDLVFGNRRRFAWHVSVVVGSGVAGVAA